MKNSVELKKDESLNLLKRTVVKFELKSSSNKVFAEPRPASSAACDSQRHGCTSGEPNLDCMDLIISN